MTSSMTPDLYTINMSDDQRALFYTEYQRLRKDEIIAILFAFFPLGGFGAHHFYLRRNGLGILYLLFFWTGVPSLVAIIECFLMPGRVRAYNALQAVALSNQILAGAPPVNVIYTAQPQPASPFTVQVCPECATPLDGTAVFCTRCGAKTAAA